MKRLLMLAAAALASCGEPPAEEAPAPEPTVAVPRLLLAAEFENLELGPKIAGPEGTEVVSRLVSDDGTAIADFVSYVACPPEVTADTCDPSQQPDGTVYTYVHTIVLDSDIETPDQSLSQRFETMLPATGFTGAIGYDGGWAEAALGSEEKVETVDDGGVLIWRVAAGDGLDASDSLTMFWQSELPPQGPAKAYRLVVGGTEYIGTGPFPPEETPEDGSVGDSPVEDDAAR